MYISPHSKKKSQWYIVLQVSHGMQEVIAQVLTFCQVSLEEFFSREHISSLVLIVTTLPEHYDIDNMSFVKRCCYNSAPTNYILFEFYCLHM